MKKAWSLAILFVAACVQPDNASNSGGSSPLDGAWKLVASEAVSPNGERFPGHSQESFLLFAGDYYSMNWATGTSSAPFSREPLRPNDAEKVARYNTLIVNAGRFDVSGGVLTIHPDFALVPEYVGGLGEFDYVLSGDMLDLEWHTIESADGTPDPDTAIGVRFHYKFVRRQAGAP